MKKGSLVVVGTGINSVGQLTTEAVAWLRVADKVLYLVGDPVTEAAIRSLTSNEPESLKPEYEEGQLRQDAYAGMVERILSPVRDGLTVCAAFYGHPGVFVRPSHDAIEQARAEGYEATMLPGISAEDCLFADLGVDPGRIGFQAYEATDFLVNQRRIDPSSDLILWQIGVLGNWTYNRRYQLKGIPILLERLYNDYPEEHGVTVYEAAVLPGCEPVVMPLPLRELGEAPLTPASTLYVPASERSRGDFEMYTRLRALAAEDSHR